MKKYKQEENETTTTMVNEPDPGRYYTAREYQHWTYEGLYEIIHGKAYKMKPSPTANHQRAGLDLGTILNSFFKNHPCEVFIAPFDVYLIKAGEDYKRCDNILEPDVCIICNKAKITNFGCVGAPDLVVEIISPSSAKKDLKLKYELYEEYGVREYWIIYPSEQKLSIFTLENGVFKSFASYTKKEIAQSKIFPALRVNLEEVFARFR